MNTFAAACLFVLFHAAAPLHAQIVEGGLLADADIAVLVRQAIVSDAARSAMSADALGRSANVRPDSDVARDVQVVLDARLGGRVQGLSVSCRNGVVVLAGSCARPEDAASAAALAAAVPGARSVESRLAQDAAPPSATATSVRPAAPGPGREGPFSFLTRDRLAGANVRIEVDKGAVTLSGTASHLRAKEMATATARLVTGVRSVTNTMDVRPANRVDDERIQKIIERRIEWSTEIVSSFQVEVKDGIARITGTARHGPGERTEVVHLAATTQGILVVDDQIVVK